MRFFFLSSRSKSVSLAATLVIFGAVACGSSANESPTPVRGALNGESAVPETCPDLEAAIATWVTAHRSCGDGLTCEYIPALDDTGSCEIVAPGGDRPELDALLRAYREKECAMGSCGHSPGTAVCESGTCQWKQDTSCEDCPRELDPQCTVDNQNALNTCFAEHCLRSKVAHPGFCEDSAECKAAGGYCEETFFTADPPCPEGTRWDPGGHGPQTKGCAGGNLRTACCMPWKRPCSYLEGSMTLDVDPFTCAPPTGKGQGWMCLFPEAAESCQLDAQILQPLNPDGPYKAKVTVVSRFGNLVKVYGEHKETGRTFRCTGKVSYDFATASEWNCEACDGDDCTKCTARQTYLCAT